MLLYVIIALAGIAVVLFPMYFIWYTVRGRHVKEKRRRQKAAAEQTAAGPRKKGKWGVEKGAYCYPAINDVMGFEFVKVVDSPDFSKPAPSEEDSTENTWAKSSGIGTNTVTQSVVSAVPNDDHTGNENDQYDSDDDKTDVRQEKQDDTEIDESIEDKQEDFDVLNKTGDWSAVPIEDYDFPSDEETLAIADKNPGCIDDNYTDEQARRIQEENEVATRARLLREKQYEIDEKKDTYSSGDQMMELARDAEIIRTVTRQNQMSEETRERPDDNDLPDTD